MSPLAALRPGADSSPRPPIRVLVVDDQVLYAEALSVLLGEHASLQVVGIAADGREAIEQAAELRPDVVLMDIEMPRLDGIKATRRIRRKLPATKVVVMTALTEPGTHARALEAGAESCVEKFSHAGDLLEAIEAAV